MAAYSATEQASSRNKRLCAAEPPTITPLATGNSVPSSTPFPLPYAFFPLAGVQPDISDISAQCSDLQ